MYFRFYEETGFPGVIGAIDCTHIRIKRPKREVESCYYNRKGYHSKNVQLVSLLLNHLFTNLEVHSALRHLHFILSTEMLHSYTYFYIC